jgi:hypothetical protein
MTKIARFSILGGLISLILFVFKTSQSSKILAASAFLVFVIMFLGTYNKKV